MTDAPTLEPPAAIPKRTWFTAETAVQAARKSHAPTSARNRVKAAAMSATEPDDDSPQDTRLILLAEQIARTRDALNGDDLEPHHRAALLRALCELLDKERIAQGKPLPGSRRPAPEGRSRGRPESLPPSAPGAGPVAAVPVSPAVSAAPARPLGWEYDG